MISRDLEISMLFRQNVINVLKNRADLVRRVRFAFVLISVLWISAEAQKSPEAKLVDEFGPLPCGDLSARLGYFDHQLRQQPESAGYVIMFGDRDDIRANMFREGLIKGYFNKHGVVLNRLRFIPSDLGNELRTQFWLVPVGSDPPVVRITEWSNKLAPNAKPFKFAWLNDFDDICPPVDEVRLFADLLKANPFARGNIVIRDTSRRAITKLKRDTLKSLVEEHGILSKQLRFFPVQKMPDGMHQRIEYWIVP